LAQLFEGNCFSVGLIHLYKKGWGRKWSTSCLNARLIDFLRWSAVAISSWYQCSAVLVNNHGIYAEGLAAIQLPLTGFLAEPI
jgi:hypothetical protein